MKPHSRFSSSLLRLTIQVFVLSVLLTVFPGALSAGGRGRPQPHPPAVSADMETEQALRESWLSVLKTVESERDRLIFSRKVSREELSSMDKNKDLAQDLANDGSFEEAIVMLKYAYLGYRSLENQIAAREMLEEMERKGGRENAPASGSTGDPGPQLLYRQGLSAYLKDDMENAAARFVGYIESGDGAYAAKARRFAVEACLRAGLDCYSAGDIKGAGRHWQAGLRAEPGHRELLHSIATFVSPRCNEYFTAGMAAYAEGDVRKAAALWKSCLELDPGYEKARKALDRLK